MANSDQTFGSVLVTGGCGFYGHNIVAAVLEAEPSCKVYAFDIDTDRSSRRHEFTTYFTGDIADPIAVDAAFAAMKPLPRVIFHTACPPSMSQNHALHWRVNVQGTRNLLAAADRVGSVHALVLVSTASVGYDGVAELRNVKELERLDASKQSRGYSRSKGVSEGEVLSANRKNSSGMLTCTLRPCTTFGPDDPHFFQNIVDVVNNGQAKYRFGKGQNLFDFIYVGNAAHAHILAARALLAAHGKAPLPAAERIEGEVFNITNEEPIPFWDLTVKTSNLCGSPISHDEIMSIPPFVGLIVAFLSEWLVWLFYFGTKESKISVAGVKYTFLTHTMNINKAKKRLGYAPRYTLVEGLNKTVAWYNKDKNQ